MLGDRPYLDATAHGHLGLERRGSMTLECMFRYPDLYQTGIAVAFVADQRYYDTIYQERYMGTPGDNPEGYKQGSPVTHAKGLKGNLLLVHGTGDDNCPLSELRDAGRSADRLDKPVSMMAYPNRSHSISEGEGTSRHLLGLMTRYLDQNMPPGPAKSGRLLHSNHEPRRPGKRRPNADLLEEIPGDSRY